MLIKSFNHIALTILLLLFTQSCFVLNKYIYTDKELQQHYSNKKVKATYHFTQFLNYKLHYAKTCINDTLPLLILLHGAPGAWFGYLNLIDDSLLQTKFKIIAVDRIGYGKSNYGKAELSTQLQALSIKHIIEKENTSNKKITLLGRSYGAPIAAWLAINYPSLVNQLIMVSPVIDPAKEKFFWFSKPGKWKITQLFLPKLLNVATKEKYAHEKEMQTLLPKWKKLYVPTTVITGANDKLADTANFSFSKKHLINCNANFFMLPNTGHLVTYEQPEFMKKIIIENK